MAVETLMFKLEGVKQASQASALAGKTFTVGKVSAVGNGVGNGLFKWLFLVPSGEAAGSTVALKIEGGRQAAQLAGLAGKTVTVGPSPTVIGGMSKWLVLNSGGGAASAGAVGVAAAGKAGAAGVAAKGKIGSNMLLMQLEGTQQAAQMKVLSGKTFTVVKSPVVGGMAKGWVFMKPAAGTAIAGKDLVALQIQNGTTANLSGMVGKSFSLYKAPLAAGNATGNWVILKPVGGVAAKSAAGAAAVATKGKGLAGLAGFEELAATGKTTGVAEVAAGKVPVAAKAATVGKTTGTTAKPAAVKALVGSGSTGSAAAATATAAKTGTIWNGTGMSLGLGWGLGAWGPVMLAGLVAAVGYGAYQYYRNSREFDEEGEEATELV